MLKLAEFHAASNGGANRVRQFLPDPPLADPGSEERVAALRSRLYAAIERQIQAGIEAGLEARLNGLGRYGPRWIRHCPGCAKVSYRARRHQRVTHCRCGGSLIWAAVSR